MSTRTVDSKTVIGVGTISPAWDAYDRYRRNSDGGNTPRELRLRGIYTENQYDSSIRFERHSPVKVGSAMNGPYNWSISTENLGGVPVPIEPIAYPDPYSLMGDLEAQWKQSEFNAGVFMAEGKEALSMGIFRLKGIDAAARALRRGNIGGALRNLTGSVPPTNRTRANTALKSKDVASAWLELHLGWVPMMNDIYSAANLLDLRPRVNRVKASNYNEIGLWASGAKEQWTVTGRERKYQSIIVEFYREPTKLEALGLTDPAGVAWEATRLSFVADWFLPIGRSLANMHAVGALPVQKVIHTNFQKLEGRSIALTRNVGGLWLDPMYQSRALDIRREYTVRRRIYDSLFPIIGVLGWLPGSISPKWDPSLWKFATASALAHSTIMSLAKRIR